MIISALRVGPFVGDIVEWASVITSCRKIATTTMVRGWSSNFRASVWRLLVAFILSKQCKFWLTFQNHYTTHNFALYFEYHQHVIVWRNLHLSNNSYLQLPKNPRSSEKKRKNKIIIGTFIKATCHIKTASSIVDPCFQTFVQQQPFY